jgi:hypothetical protein
MACTATTHTPMPGMIIRQIKGPSWRIRLVKLAWRMRAEIYALDDRGDIATINGDAEVLPLSKRSKLYSAVTVMLDHLAGSQANTVHVFAYSPHAKEPVLVRLPIEPVAGFAVSA